MQPEKNDNPIIGGPWKPDEKIRVVVGKFDWTSAFPRVRISVYIRVETGEIKKIENVLMNQLDTIAVMMDPPVVSEDNQHAASKK